MPVKIRFTENILLLQSSLYWIQLLECLLLQQEVQIHLLVPPLRMCQLLGKGHIHLATHLKCKNAVSINCVSWCGHHAKIKFKKLDWKSYNIFSYFLVLDPRRTRLCMAEGVHHSCPFRILANLPLESVLQEYPLHCPFKN